MTILAAPTDLFPLPTQPSDVPWPADRWPTGPVPAGVDSAALDSLLSRAFGPDPDPGFGDSYATIVVHRGRIVVEQYGPGTDAETPLLSWSMAKSVTHALVGILVQRGQLDLHGPAPVAEWAEPGDPRNAITLHQMLRMVDGLDFNETYSIEPGPGEEKVFSHCIDGAYAASRPARSDPDTTFNYSSGTSNIVARMVCDIIGRNEPAVAWMHEHLFEPMGMTSMTPSFDEAGNFVGSSYFHATARDWARFGLLYLRGGQWGDRQLVPRSWVDDGRTPRARGADGRYYGAHWWIAEDGRATFGAGGYEFQRVACVPESDLVAVRLGKTAVEDYETPKQWFEDLISLFDG